MKAPSLRSAALLLSLLLLAACGGGGGSSSNPYVEGGGVTTPARITSDTDNATTLALGVYDAGVSSGNIAGDVPLAPAGTGARASAASVRAGALARDAASLATESVLPAGTGRGRAPSASVDEYREDGLGGSVHLTGKINEDTGSFSLTLRATSWHGDSGGILDGTLKLSGVVDLASEAMVRMTMTFSSLTYSDDSGSATVNGRIRMENYDLNTAYVDDLFLTDNRTGKTLWLENLQLFSTEIYDPDRGASYTLSSITGQGGLPGRIYFHDLGCVEVDTPVPFRTYEGESRPEVGTLVITGALSHRVSIEVPGVEGYSFTLRIDDDGDGEWEYAIGAYWPEENV